MGSRVGAAVPAAILTRTRTIVVAAGEATPACFKFDVVIRHLNADARHQWVACLSHPGSHSGIGAFHSSHDTGCEVCTYGSEERTTERPQLEN
jgi:hypothetical protein